MEKVDDSASPNPSPSHPHPQATIHQQESARTPHKTHHKPADTASPKRTGAHNQTRRHLQQHAAPQQQAEHRTGRLPRRNTPRSNRGTAQTKQPTPPQEHPAQKSATCTFFQKPLIDTFFEGRGRWRVSDGPRECVPHFYHSYKK